MLNTSQAEALPIIIEDGILEGLWMLCSKLSTLPKLVLFLLCKDLRTLHLPSSPTHVQATEKIVQSAMELFEGRVLLVEKPSSSRVEG